MEETNHDAKSKFVKLRQQRGLTQKAIALALGVSERTVIYWESGQHPPKLSIPQIKILCRLLDVAVEELPDSFGPVAH